MGQVRAYTVSEGGMDLRDYFANNFISNSGIPFNKERFLDHAKDAYKWADAMMEARK